MSDAQDHQREALSKVALLLSLGGVLVPLVLAMLTLVVPTIKLSEEQGRTFMFVAIGGGLVTEVLALVLGIASWEHLFGKVAVGCAAVILLLAAGVASTMVLGYVSLEVRQDETHDVQVKPAGVSR